jgi:post-segregation antitoxin (ccd killing protein)
MARRPGKTSTVSISVDAETEDILRSEAERSYGGNVSALVAAIAKEAKRQGALDWLLANAGARPMSAADRRALLAELDGKRPRKKRAKKAA